jgi:hypothetical protein
MMPAKELNNLGPGTAIGQPNQLQDALILETALILRPLGPIADTPALTILPPPAISIPTPTSVPGPLPTRAGKLLPVRRHNLDVSVHEVLLVLGEDFVGEFARDFDDGVAVEFIAVVLEAQVLLLQLLHLQELDYLALAGPEW